jgi:hypothetical protein
MHRNGKGELQSEVWKWPHSKIRTVSAFGAVTHYTIQEQVFKLIKMSNGLNNVYLIVALVATSFAAGRFYADGSLIEENHKLNESLRFLRGEKLGFAHEKSGSGPWRDEKRPAPVAVTPTTASGREPDTKPASPVEAPVVVAASTATPALAEAVPMATPTPAAVAEKPRAETVTQDSPPSKVAVNQQEPVPAHALDKPEAASAPSAPKDGKTGKKWVSDLGDHVQGTATYWHCNNPKLVASGMDYYAYGSVPASLLKKQGDAYSVRDGRAIVISGCWSPKLGKAILYRKSDGLRWEPPFNVDKGPWMPG